MCGIAGFTLGGRAGAAPSAVIADMLAAIANRGPDDSGIHVDRGVAFGHLRLTIVDPVGGRQPRVDKLTGDALVFNGEIYGYKALQDELAAAGVNLVDRSDTEVLFRMLQRDGLEATLERVDGQFAFAFLEGRSGRIHLARDRFGEKPLFWGIRDGRLAFASEPRALRRHPDWADAPVDPGAVATFLDFEYLPADRALRAGMRKLQPGHALTFENGAARVWPFWRPKPNRDAAAAEPDETARIDRLDALLRQSVRDRLVADVPVGVFLSGGIDSSMVAVVAAQESPGITAFTVQMPDEDYDETPAARLLAQRHGMRHTVLPFDDAAAVEALAAVRRRIDDPLADSSLLPSWVLSRAARTGMKVALGGDGADELFAGYVSFKALPWMRAMAALPPALGRAARAALAPLARGAGYMGFGFKATHVSQGFGLAPEHQWHAWMAPFAPEDLDRLWRPEARAAAEAAKIDALAALLESDTGGRFDAARLLLLFTGTYLPEDILAKVDRASMDHGLEVRAPYLARGFAEYALSLPASDKISGLETKRLFRKLARRHLPAEIVDRRKHGFAAPMARLLRGALAEPVAASILGASSPLA